MVIFASVPVVFRQKYEHYSIKVERKPYIWERNGTLYQNTTETIH